MRMPSANPSHTFSQVPRAQIPRSVFDRSHGIKTTFDAGQLVPIYVDDVLPGDTFQVSMTGFARLSTPLKPIMDNLYMETFWFFVPNRLVWTNWQRFCGEQDDPGDSTSFLIPIVTMPVAGFILNSLADYMGIPPAIAWTASAPSALPFRGYALIYNQWFRDQNMQPSRDVQMGDGPDDAEDCGANIAPLNRGKRHDYFTSCLPWPQKGGAVSIFSQGSQAPVTGIGHDGQVFAAAGADVWETGGTATTDYPFSALIDDAADRRFYVRGTAAAAGTPMIYANLTAATGASINELRQAFQIQKLLERDARGGTRYTEIIRAHFGVVSPDARLQRPEYLGGGSTPVVVSPVAQTAPQQAAGVTTPQGNLAAIGTASWDGHGFVKSFTEHGYVFGLVCVRADLTYSQGLERHWSRRTRYEFYWPALSHIGEQAVLNREIFIAVSETQNVGVFGYQERYAEYRYKQSQLTSLFRVDAAGTLSVWHLSQDFASLPTLDASFIIENPPVDRVIAVPTEPHFILDGYIRIKAARPMPLFGVPGMMDHF